MQIINQDYVCLTVHKLTIRLPTRQQGHALLLVVWDILQLTHQEIAVKLARLVNLPIFF